MTHEMLQALAQLGIDVTVEADWTGATLSNGRISIDGAAPIPFQTLDLSFDLDIEGEAPIS